MEFNLDVVDNSNINSVTQSITVQEAYTGTNLDDVIAGLDGFLATLQDAINGQVYGNSLPLLGTSLSTTSAAQFISDFRDDIRNQLEAEASLNPETIRQALLEALGSNGLSLLQDLNGDNIVDAQDIEVIETADEVKFNLKISSENSFNSSLATDIGLPGLGLALNGSTQVDLGFDFNLEFGVHQTNGFYFDTAATDELSIHLNASIPNLEASGELGFLQLNIIDDNSQFEGSFSVDLQDSDNQLSFSELPSVNLGNLIDAQLNGLADINLNAVTSFNGSAVLPSFSTDINIDWGFSNASADPANFSSLGSTPNIAFNNVQMNLGTFFSDFVEPILTQIQEIIEPIQPIIDLLTEPLPGFSDLSVITDALDQNNDGNVSLLDLAKTIAPDSNFDFIEAVAELTTLINSIPTNAGDIAIDLGSFDLGSTDIRAVTNLEDVIPDITESALDVISQLQSSGATEASSFVSSLNSSDAGELSFPILTDPTTGFRLLLGQTADLFTYDMPALNFGFEYSQFFPIIGPLGVSFSGNLAANIDLAFGYDTFGLQQFANSGDTADIFQGFFVNDLLTNPDGSIDDVAEVILSAEIGAAAAIDILVAEAGVEGGIRANVKFNLNDPNNDGKIRVDEILDLFNENPLCLFDTQGKLTAGIYAYYETLISDREEFGLGEIELASFEYGCHDTSGLVLAQGIGNGVLQLNMGSNSASRVEGDLSDGDEAFTVQYDSGSVGSETVSVSGFGARKQYSSVTKIVADSGVGNDVINIQAGVEAQADLSGGIGDDRLYYRGTGTAILRGGEGNDQLLSGLGSDQIFGDNGEDRLLGGDGDDQLEGGNSDDQLDGGVGDDQLFGGSSDDYLVGGLGADTLNGGDGIDAVSYLTAGAGVAFDLAAGIGSSGEAAGDIFLSIERFTGSSYGDSLRGSASTDFINGAGGSDTIYGGAGDDIINPGLGSSDSVDGEAGNDLLILDYSVGDTGQGVISSVNDHSDGAYGSFYRYQTSLFSTLDYVGFYGIERFQVTGTSQNDDLKGWRNNDTLIGGAGDDTLYGNQGNDIIDGGEGDDYLTGGLGDDLLRSGIGNDTLSGEGGHDVFVLAASEGTDTILDFQVGQDLLGLSAGLTFEQLALTQGMGVNANDTLISIADSGELLASLSGVQASTVTSTIFTLV